MLRFALRLFSRAGPGIILALVILLLPNLAHVNKLLGALQLPVGVILLVCALGKALYDTLFYDHYQP